MTRIRILIGFLSFGIIIGFVTAWWSQISDSIFWLNFPGALFGDAVYLFSIEAFGNPYSAQAHYTIPWLFRVPQVYVPVSIFFWGLIGLIIQLARNVHYRKYALKQTSP